MLKAREVMRMVERAGFSYQRNHGGHAIFTNRTSGKVTLVPQHGGTDIDRPVLRAIIKQVGMTDKDFLALR